MTKSLIWIVALFLSQFGALAAFADESVTVTEINIKGLTFAIPSTYERLHGFEAESDFQFAYGDNEVEDGKYARLVLVQSLGAPSEQELLTRSALPDGSEHIDILRLDWNGITIDGLRIPELIDDSTVLTFNIQFPMKTDTVVVSLFGQGADEEFLLELLDSVLASAEGESSWKAGAPSSRAVYTAPPMSRQILFLTIPVVALVMSSLIYFGTWRKLPRGLFLLLSLIVMGIGYAGMRDMTEDGIVIRYSKITIQMTAFIGLLYGIWDIFRSRGPKPRELIYSDKPDPPNG